MIALDASSLIAYLDGSAGTDVQAVAFALEQQQGVLPPVVVTELLSEPTLATAVRQMFLTLPQLPVDEGYWERAGALRAKVIAKGHKAYLADTLIVQSCLDHQVPLITRDGDFDRFIPFGLRLFGQE